MKDVRNSLDEFTADEKGKCRTGDVRVALLDISATRAFLDDGTTSASIDAANPEAVQFSLAAENSSQKISSKDSRRPIRCFVSLRTVSKTSRTRSKVPVMKSEQWNL